MRNIIIYIGSFFLPDKSAGAHRALSLSKSFRDLKYEMILVGMDERQNSISIMDTKNTCEGFETYTLPKPSSMKDWIHHTISITEYKKLMKEIGLEKIFAVIAMEYEAIALLKLRKFCNKNGIALIADAEEWYEKSRLRFPMNIGKDLDTFLRMYYVYPKCIENMICISRFFEEHYSNDIQNLVYIPGTIDIEEEKWKQISEYYPNHVLTIGYAGHPGMHFEKERLDWLVSAILELNKDGFPCKLHIAGIDEDFLKKRMSIDIEDSIVFFGKVSHRECLEMLSKCDFSAIIREDKRVTKAGFPTKFSESIGCGTPVITTASSNLKEYIIEGETGYLCDDFSMISIKQAIIKASQISKNKLIRVHQNLREKNFLIYSNFTTDLEKYILSIKQ